MTIKKDISSWSDLVNTCWSGASDILEQAEKVNREDEVLEYLDEVFSDNEPTETELNDFIWFELDDELKLYDDGEDE